MATENLKTGSITDLDTIPPLRHIAGSGAVGTVRVVEDQLTATDAVTAGSYYKMVRLPSTAYLKKLEWWVESSVTTFTNDIDLWYSDSTLDGTKVANQNTLVLDQAFGAAIAMATAAEPADVAYKLTGDKLNQPLWEVGGLSSDPGGMFDIVLTNTTTNSGAPVVHVRATYVVAN